MTRVKHIHSSGRHDRDRRVVRRALDSYAERHPAVLTLTEYQGKDHRAALIEWAITHDYSIGQAPGAAGNCALAVAPGWSLERFWSHQLTRHEQRRGPGGPPPPQCATAIVRHTATGKRCLWSLAHLPPNVEGDFRRPGKPAYRVWLWLRIVREWRRHLRRIARRHNVRRRAVVADFNLNVERAWVRAALRARFPGLRLTWRDFPGPGTHHRRVIDATLTNLRILEAAELLPDDASSDHRPYVEVLEL
jgi:hypothetical protein